MPFTLAHPLAVLPLVRPMGRFGVASALAIGSVSPDLWYFVPIGVNRVQTHSTAGVLLFCLPVSLCLYLVFHGLLKQPLLALAPEAVARRLAARAPPDRLLPEVSWAAVVVSILAGVLTHLAWDAFTHWDAPGVAAFPALRTELFSIGRYDVHAYSVLQHASSVLGTLALAVWLAWRIAREPEGPFEPVLRLQPAVKCAVIAGVTGLAVWLSVFPLVEIAPTSGTGLGTARALVRTRLAGAGTGFAVGVLAYAVAWQLAAHRQGRRAVRRT